MLKLLIKRRDKKNLHSNITLNDKLELCTIMYRV